MRLWGGGYEISEVVRVRSVRWWGLWDCEVMRFWSLGCGCEVVRVRLWSCEVLRMWGYEVCEVERFWDCKGDVLRFVRLMFLRLWIWGMWGWGCEVIRSLRLWGDDVCEVEVCEAVRLRFVMFVRLWGYKFMRFVRLWGFWSHTVVSLWGWGLCTSSDLIVGPGLCGVTMEVIVWCLKGFVKSFVWSMWENVEGTEECVCERV